LLVLLLLLSIWREKIEISFSSLLVPSGFFLLYLSLLYCFSSEKPLAIVDIRRYLLSVGMYIVIINIVRSSSEIRWVCGAWLSGSFLSVLYGILQHYGGFWRLGVPQMERVMSTFGNPIFFAAHLVVSIPLAIGLLGIIKKTIGRLFLMLYIAVGCWALYYTQTRAAFIGFAVSLTIIGFLQIQKKALKAMFVMLVLVVSGVFFVATKQMWHRQQAHGLIWRDTLVMWLHHPVIGTGPGTFHIYFPSYASRELKQVWPLDQNIVNNAHNEYIQVLSETGIIGLGLLLWVVVIYYYIVIRKGLSAQNGQRLLSVGIMSATSGILVQNIFSSDMRFTISSIYLFLLMGLSDSQIASRVSLPAISKAGRGAATAIILFAAGLTFPKIIHLYSAPKNVAAAPDFFDERVLAPAKTIADLEQMARKYPTQPLVFEKLGWVYAKERNWGKAIESYNHVIELNSRSAGAHNNSGNIYFLLGDRLAAINCWQSSLKINPEQIDSRLNLATAYYYEGNLKEASNQLTIILKKDPSNEKAMVLLKQMQE
jgi:O-antigen ligase